MRHMTEPEHSSPAVQSRHSLHFASQHSAPGGENSAPLTPMLLDSSTRVLRQSGQLSSRAGWQEGQLCRGTPELSAWTPPLSAPWLAWRPRPETCTLKHGTADHCGSAAGEVPGHCPPQGVIPLRWAPGQEEVTRPTLARGCGLRAGYSLDGPGQARCPPPRRLHTVAWLHCGLPPWTPR